MTAIKNLTGRKFNLLTPLFPTERKNGQTYWLCRCECGELKPVQYSALVSGNSKSCGCLRRQKTGNMGRSRLIDLTGRKFGSLTVIARARSDKHDNPRWICECECGERIEVYGFYLRAGKKRSCGCVIPEPEDEFGPLSKAAFFNFLDEGGDPDRFLRCARTLRGIESDDIRDVKITGESIDARVTKESIALFLSGFPPAKTNSSETNRTGYTVSPARDTRLSRSLSPSAGG